MINMMHMLDNMMKIGSFFNGSFFVKLDIVLGHYNS